MECVTAALVGVVVGAAITSTAAPRTLLRAVAPRGSAELLEALDRLHALLERDGAPPPGVEG